MTADETAFLAAIKGEPSDTIARRVFADWLDDHDRAEEAAVWRGELDVRQVRAIFREPFLAEGALGDGPREVRLRQRELPPFLTPVVRFEFDRAVHLQSFSIHEMSSAGSLVVNAWDKPVFVLPIEPGKTLAYTRLPVDALFPVGSGLEVLMKSVAFDSITLVIQFEAVNDL